MQNQETQNSIKLYFYMYKLRHNCVTFINDHREVKESKYLKSFSTESRVLDVISMLIIENARPEFSKDFPR